MKGRVLLVFNHVYWFSFNMYSRSSGDTTVQSMWGDHAIALREPSTGSASKPQGSFSTCPRLMT